MVSDGPASGSCSAQEGGIGGRKKRKKEKSWF